MVSEPIVPEAGGFDPAAMAMGVPGLPGAFVWRGARYGIAACDETWRSLRPEVGGGELYVRRHYFTLRMEDGSRWVVYCLRQPSTAGGGRQRWYLYTNETEQHRAEGDG